MKILMSEFACLFLAFLMTTCPVAANGAYDFLPQEWRGDLDFTELEIGDLVVYYHQRMIGRAVVEHDCLVYQFERTTGQLLKKRTHWRDDLPDQLPALTVTQEQARFLAGGQFDRSRLIYISPESSVFPLESPPENPCWVVYSEMTDELVLTVIDAVTGQNLGRGVPPPRAGFGFSGPANDYPCSSSWLAWVLGATDWFPRMGYQETHTIWPSKDELQEQLQSPEIALFYEIAHGGSTSFASSCSDYGSYLMTFAYDIKNWLADYPKIPFSFVASCDGLCSTEPRTFSYELRKGEDVGTATVGYCGMSNLECDDCWMTSLRWQDALFTYFAGGHDVATAFTQAMADYPSCFIASCMRYDGDPELALVPTLARTPGDVPGLFSETVVTLEPGVEHTISLAPSCEVRGYVAEITPLENQDAEISSLRYAPTFDGILWVDSFCLQLGSADPATQVNVRIYETRGMPLIRQWLSDLKPSLPNIFLLGPSSEIRSFVAEVTPLVNKRVSFERIIVKPEFDGNQWNDVLEITTSLTNPSHAIESVVQVYSGGELPLFTNFQTYLTPGEVHSFVLRSSNDQQAYVPEISPLTEAPAVFERIAVVPRFDGAGWNDVLEVQTGPDSSELEVDIRVYVLADGEPSHTPQAGSGLIDGVCALGQNAPNPFNPRTHIRFWLQESRSAKLEIFALDGRRLAVLVDGPLPEGEHSATWSGCDRNGRQCPSGVYFYRLTAGNQTETRRMTLLR